MTSNKDTAIKEISNEFEKLSNLVLVQMDILMSVLSNEDEILETDNTIEKLNENESRIDVFEVQLDDLIVRSIVLYKPVATDLRLLFAIYRMVINLERIGDLVIKVSDAIEEMKASEFYKKSKPMLHNMLKQASLMVNKSLLSFINKDKEAAIWTIKRDAEIDEMNRKLLRASIKKGDLPKEKDALVILSDIRSIVSSFERIGDHATNIAEASIYALLGSNIKHKKLSGKHFL